MADLSLKLTAFEGPLDLLLHLIERDKVDIYDIPIAAVTEQYISYLRSMSEFDMEVASDFPVMAATLLQIKSRMLLPKQSAEGEEEETDRASSWWKCWWNTAALSVPLLLWRI